MNVRLAVSSIAWSPSNDEAVADLLRVEGAHGIELAPTMWRDDPYAAPRAEVLELRTRWENRGLPIVSLQALLFGRPELQLFGDRASRDALRDYLKRAIDFAQAVGARPLVFGSPKNRQRGALSMADAMRVARDFFAGIAEYAGAHGTAVCLEANPPSYGCDFLVTTAEAVALCRSIDHPGIRVNGDLGGMLMSGEDIATVIDESAPCLGHFHASEPELVELKHDAAHEEAASSLARTHYDGWVSIEMRRSAEGELDAIRRAVRLAKRCYGLGAGR